MFTQLLVCFLRSTTSTQLIRNISNKMSSSSQRHLVFVYGTLKRGEPNHFLMEDKTKGVADFVALGQTAEKFPLVIASRYNIPFLLDQKGTGKHVIGDVFSVDDAMLAVLDELECHPTYYTRRLERIEPLQPNTNLKDNSKAWTGSECWAYFLGKFRPVLLEKPFLESYESKGNHGLPYVESEETESTEDIYDD